MLEIRNLTKIYKPKKGVPVIALDNVSLKLPDRGMVFVLGKSGSGKSTLLNVLGGLDSFTSGEFIIKGEEAKVFKQMHYDSYRNTYIGFIFQEYNILKDFTVRGNIALALELQGRPSSNEEINRILKEVDLVGYGDRKPNELSGGQMQRVAIARALVKNPKIIMADEPTGALDSKTGEAIFETLKKLSRDKLVLIVSHDRDFSERYADRIIELADGKIISDVSLKNEIKDDEGLPESNLEFKENQIKITNGFALSDEEFLQIKDYIKNYNGPLDLNLAGAASKKYVFEDTDIGNIQMDNSGFKLIKSKLSLKNSFRIGASGLKHKKVKLIFTILLSFIAFTFFGLADTAASYKLKKTAINSIIDTGIDYASIIKKHKYASGDLAYYAKTNLSEEDLTYLKQKTGLNLKGVYYNSRFTSLGLDSFYFLINFENIDYFGNYYTTAFNGCIEFDQNDINQFGYHMLPGSTIPDGNKDEIMLTKYEASSFVGAKLILFDDTGAAKEEVSITKETDLINKTFYLGNKNYIVTGIIDTNMDLERFACLKGEPETTFDLAYVALMLEIESLKANSLHSLLFVGKGFCDKNGISKINTFTDSKNGSFRIMNLGNDNDEFDYYNFEYVSQFTFNDLINDAQDEYFIITSDHQEFNGIKNNQIIISDNIMYQLLNAKLYNHPEFANISAERFNKTYHINGEDYTLFSFLNLTSNAKLDSFISTLSPNFGPYGAYQYALELLSVDYDKWFNEAQALNLVSEGNEVEDLLNYLISSSKYVAYYQYSGTALSKEMHRINTEAIYELYQEFTNCGVELVFDDYSYDEDKRVNYKLDVSGVVYANNTYMYSYVILNDELWNKYFDYNPYEIYNFVVGEMTTTRDLVRNLIEMTLDETKDVKYELTNNVLDEVFGLREVFSLMAKVFIWIGVIFAIFASLLLSNFIATSISYKKEEIGILRAIGSRSNDVFRIFFSEAFIIAMINFVLAAITTLLITILINNALRNETALQVTIISFGFRQVLLLFLLCTVSSFIASFLPVYKNARKKPIDAIRNR